MSPNLAKQGDFLLWHHFTTFDFLIAAAPALLSPNIMVIESTTPTPFIIYLRGHSRKPKQTM
jgi:hypothetical protein